MTDSLKRRDFIKTLSLAGASIAITNNVSISTPPGSDKGEIKNGHFTVSFDKKKGTIDIHRNDGTVLLTGGTACVNLDNKYRISPENYKYSFDSNSTGDQNPLGKTLIVVCKDKAKKLDSEIRLSLYDNIKAVTIEVVCKNVSRSDISMRSIEPLRVIKNEGAMLTVPGVLKCITNGEMYYDTGTIHEFGKKDDGISSGELKGVKLANGPISSQTETMHSWWNACLFSGYEKESTALGYLENNSCLGNLLMTKSGPDEISFLAESVYAPILALKPGKTISSNRLMINIGADPYVALEMYANEAGKANGARTRSIVNGWCSWFYTLSKVSEAEVVSNTEFAAKHLKQFGLEYIQIDEGYQRWHGDWEGNDRFPHGMKWLANKIRGYGFKPGIWISPYVISAPTEVFQKHPDWLLKKTDGSLKRIGNWEEGAAPPADETPKRYGLDITHPEAAKWLHDLVNTIVNDWGYEMIKIDFMAWSILAAELYYDPTVSSAQAYRKGLEIMRKAAGDKCHILECGPGATTIGLIDSMRLEADVNYGYSNTAWETYFVHPACSASAAAKRYYFHNRTWTNDVDHVCMDLLNNQQSEAVATLIAMSGGNMISGDRLTQLDEYKLDILKKITPSLGEAAKPVDLFDDEVQSVFALKIEKPVSPIVAGWTVAAFFNSNLAQPIERKFSLQRLWLDPKKTYLAFDFWKQQFVGEVTGEIKLTIQSGSVVLLTLHEKSGRPQFISTDRHVMQGALEIEYVSWDENTKTISGTSVGPLNTSHNVFIYVPDPHPWTWSGSGLFRDHDSYSLKLVGNNIIRVHVNFERSDHVKWEINPDNFLQ